MITLVLLLGAGRLVLAVDYEKQVKPLLKARCYACHGALKQKGGLRLDTAASARQGGDSGSVAKGEPALLIERVTTTDKKEHMPPEGEGAPLNPAEVALLKDWLASGAPGPATEQPEADPRTHWAYQPPKSAGQTVDALIEARLSAKHLQAQPEAPPEVWLRRVSLDLTGLPPKATEVTAFLKAVRATSPPGKAYEEVVDRLLASPQYGERWARHFMDIWRYCDWYGLGAQLRHSQKHLWHWRDWIVESLNADKGYDRMIVEQLAADELAPEDQASLRATGFLARSYYLFNRTTWLDETIEHTCRAFLGVTMQCVKCHDHKYDPIEQADYYRMRAIFEPMHVRLDPVPGVTDLEKDGLPRVFDLHLDQPTYRHVRGDEKNEDKSRPMPPGLPAVLAFADYKPSTIALPATASQPALLPFVKEDQFKAVLQQRDTALQKKDDAAAKLASLRLRVVQAVLSAEQQPQDESLKKAAAAASAAYNLAKAEADLAALKRTATPADAKKKADHTKKLKTATDAVTAAKKVVDTGTVKFEPLKVALKAQEGPEDSKNAEVQTFPATSTGRRLALAQWIADKRNPLTARVLVNQVWLRHFGASFVPDVSDFGRRAVAPLHQDVLDTLAADFMEHGWSLKHLHRTLVLSALYRRSSSNAGADPATLAADPDNACYWRMNPRRLESQAVRDCLLFLTGKLDLTLGGPSLDPEKAESTPRRSLYFVQNADVEHRFLATFDNANVLECYRRNESVVPQQALALTNSKLSRECAETLAAKGVRVHGDSFIEDAFLALLGRYPTQEELDISTDSLRGMKNDRVLFLQALISHNDFVTLR